MLFRTALFALLSSPLSVLSAELRGSAHQPRELVTTCTNTYPFGSVDSGCPVDAPVCLLDGVEPSLDDDGNDCVKCVNSVKGEGPDNGCGNTDGEYACADDAGTILTQIDSVGTKCVEFFCKNNKDASGVDKNCHKDARICMTKDDGLPDPDAFGDHCVKCVITEDGGEQLGCHNTEKPICADSNGDPLLSKGEIGFQCIEDLAPTSCPDGHTLVSVNVPASEHLMYGRVREFPSGDIVLDGILRIGSTFSREEYLPLDSKCYEFTMSPAGGTSNFGADGSFTLQVGSEPAQVISWNKFDSISGVSIGYQCP